MAKEYKEYLEFMTNPDNEFNCEYCPENVGHDGNGFDYRYPCNQQNCWVTCHIRQIIEKDAAVMVKHLG